MAEVVYNFPNASASLVAGANITLSSGGGNITVIGGVNAGATTFLAGVSSGGNTSGATGVVNNQVVFVGGNNVTLSESKNLQSATITISAFNESQSVGVSNLGNTAGTTGLASAANLRYVLVGGSNISLSQSLNVGSGGGTVTINGANQTTGSQSIGVLSDGNTMGTTGYASGNLINYEFVGLTNITLSQSVNGASGTMTIIGMLPGELIQPVSSANYSGSITKFYAAMDHIHRGVYSAGVSTGGNTAGSTAVLPGQLVLAGGNGLSLSQSTNASNEMTVSIMGATNFALATKSVNYSIANSDYIVVETVAVKTITLPTAVGIAGKVFIVKNSSGGTITLDTTAGQTIDGTTPLILAPLSSLTVVSDGANWVIIS